MRRSLRITLGVVLVALAAVIAVGCLYRGYLTGILPTTAADVADITLPPGFRIAVYAPDVPNARQIALGPPGVVFVGSRSEGKVYAVVDRDGDHRADQVHVLASGLAMPSGVAFRDGSLYVAEVNRILRFRDVSRDLTSPPAPEVVTSAYPSDRHHALGTPEDCVETIQRFAEAGADHVAVIPTVPPARVPEHLARIAEEIVPAFRGAGS